MLFFASRYVDSLVSDQLLGDLSTDLDDCEPLTYNGSLVLHPCGVIANSLFNDIYTVTSDHVMDESDIAWATDVKDKVRARFSSNNWECLCSQLCCVAGQ